jgi:hypothetical protein
MVSHWEREARRPVGMEVPALCFILGALFEREDWNRTNSSKSEISAKRRCNLFMIRIVQELSHLLVF